MHDQQNVKIQHIVWWNPVEILTSGQLEIRMWEAACLQRRKHSDDVRSLRRSKQILLHVVVQKRREIQLNDRQ